MTAEFHKTKKLLESLEEWYGLDISKRKSLINELSEMAVESATSDGRFAGSCSAAANILFAINQYPDILALVKEKHETTNE